MSGTASLDQMMFKAKLRAKCGKAELEIEVEGSLAFLTNFLYDFNKSVLENTVFKLK